MRARRYLLRVIPSLLVLVLFGLHVLGHVQLQVIEKLEQFAYDARLRLTAPGGVDPRIVIIDIDERSLREEGHWPWSRDKIARMLDNLFDVYGVAAVGFDVVFAEQDSSDDLRTLVELGEGAGDQRFVDRLAEFAPALDRDRVLAEALAGHAVVLGYYFNTGLLDIEEAGVLPEPLFMRDELFDETLEPPRAISYVGNIATLHDSGASAGFFSIGGRMIDGDGVIRRAPLLIEYEGNLYSSLSLALAIAYQDDIVLPAFSEDPSVDEIEALELGGARIPIDRDAAVLIPYRRHSGGYPYASATDVINQTLDNPQGLDGTIVLVGTSAPGLQDLKPTPVQNVFPGVEVHANVVAGILDGRFKYRPSYTRGAELAVLLLVGLLLAFLLPVLGPLSALVLVVAAVGVVVGGNIYLWHYHNLDLPVAATISLAVILAAVNAAYGFAVEFRMQRQLRSAFSSYLAPTLVQQLVDNPDKLQLMGEVRVMTFLFTDVANFTTFVEKTAAEDVVRIHNQYLDGMAKIVMDNGGTIDKFVGDAVIAIFNAPLDQADHAQRAVHAALEMDRFAEQFVDAKNAEGFTYGHTRIGVNTGTAVVGNFGGHRRFDYTAYGDVVNTAARLESANKPLGTRVCVARSTVDQCPEQAFRPIGSLLLKGKETAVDAYQPVAQDASGKEHILAYQKAFELLAGTASDAAQAFSSLAGRYPDDPLIRFHDRRIASGATGVVIDLT